MPYYYTLAVTNTTSQPIPLVFQQSLKTNMIPPYAQNHKYQASLIHASLPFNAPNLVYPPDAPLMKFSYQGIDAFVTGQDYINETGSGPVEALVQTSPGGRPRPIFAFFIGIGFRTIVNFWYERLLQPFITNEDLIQQFADHILALHGDAEILATNTVIAGTVAILTSLINLAIVRLSALTSLPTYQPPVLVNVSEPPLSAQSVFIEPTNLTLYTPHAYLSSLSSPITFSISQLLAPYFTGFNKTSITATYLGNPIPMYNLNITDQGNNLTSSTQSLSQPNSILTNRIILQASTLNLQPEMYDQNIMRPTLADFIANVPLDGNVYYENPLPFYQVNVNGELSDCTVIAYTALSDGTLLPLKLLPNQSASIKLMFTAMESNKFS